MSPKNIPTRTRMVLAHKLWRRSGLPVLSRHYFALGSLLTFIVPFLVISLSLFFFWLRGCRRGRKPEGIEGEGEGVAQFILRPPIGGLLRNRWRSASAQQTSHKISFGTL